MSRELDFINFMDNMAIQEGRTPAEPKAPTNRDLILNAISNIDEYPNDSGLLLKYESTLLQLKQASNIKQANAIENELNELEEKLQNVIISEKQKIYTKLATKGRETLAKYRLLYETHQEQKENHGQELLSKMQEAFPQIEVCRKANQFYKSLEKQAQNSNGHCTPPIKPSEDCFAKSQPQYKNVSEESIIGTSNRMGVLAYILVPIIVTVYSAVCLIEAPPIVTIILTIAFVLLMALYIQAAICISKKEKEERELLEAARNYEKYRKSGHYSVSFTEYLNRATRDYNSKNIEE